MLNQALEKVIKKPINWKAAAGFDGYVDRLARVVKKRDNNGNVSYYATLREFGTAVQQMAGLSGDREILVQCPQIGGNAPIFCEALNALGAEGTLIGCLGVPSNPIFTEGLPLFHCISLGECGETLALEFDDGKLMLANVEQMNAVSIDTIMKMGQKKMVDQSFQEADLILFANWNQLHHSTELWSHFGAMAAQHAKMIYLDLADITQNDKEALYSLFSSLSFSFTLGCNEKEAKQLCECMFQFHADDIRQILTCLSTRLACEVVIHGIDYAAWAFQDDCIMRKGRLVQHPVTTTGGGDHFNAGYCFAVMQGCNIPDALDFGMAASGAFVETGKTAGLGECLQYLSKHICR